MGKQLHSEYNPMEGLTKLQTDLKEMVRLSDAGLMPKGHEITQQVADAHYTRTVDDLASK